MKRTWKQRLKWLQWKLEYDWSWRHLVMPWWLVTFLHTHFNFCRAKLVMWRLYHSTPFNECGVDGCDPAPERGCFCGEYDDGETARQQRDWKMFNEKGMWSMRIKKSPRVTE